MARHRLTREDKIRGIRAALRSPKTPRHFKSGLRRHLARLEGREVSGRGKRQRPVGFLGWLSF